MDAVIWATGFEFDHSWIEPAVKDENGAIQHRRGVTAVEGLYFLGLPWQHTRGSALLGWVKDDAEYIAEQIASRRPTNRRAGSGTRSYPRRCRGAGVTSSEGAPRSAGKIDGRLAEFGLKLIRQIRSQAPKFSRRASG